MQRRMLLSLSIVVTLAAPAYSQLRDGRDNPLAAARDLYASARYDEALAVLNGLPKDNAVADRKSVEQYRSLCLLALGRGAEAESAIAAVVTADPLFVPGEADASPRVRTAFSDVRQRLLPQIVQTRYAAAKAAFERKEWDAAQTQFRDLLTLLDDPQMGGKQGDLRTLAKGFLDLAVAAAAPPPEPKRADPPPPAQAAAAAAPAPAPAPRVDKIWSADEPGVVLPVIIRQEVPRVPVNIARQVRDRGMLEIVIDEQGRVISMAVRMSMHPIYDPLLLSAARDWRYKPATVNGTPVKFRKIIQITIDKR
jgi:TonB family protein